MRKHFLGNILVLSFSFVFVILVMEIFLRIINIQPGLGEARGLIVEDKYVGWRLSPDFQGVSKEREYVTTTNINSDGFRSDVPYYNKNKPEGIMRVAVLGDSFTYGAGVNNGETYPDIMQKYLGQRYEVINMGVGGYGTVNQVHFLKHYGMKYNPDIVIVGMFLGNDVIDNLERIDKVRDNITSKDNSIFLEKTRRIFRRSHAYNFFSRRVYAVLTKIGMREYYGGKMQYDYMIVKNYSPEVNRGIHYTEKDIVAIGEICNGKNIRLIFVLIPLKDQVTDINWSRFYEYHHLYDRDKPQRIIKDILERYNIEYLDLLPKMRSSERRDFFYYTKDPHFTAEGCQFVGEEIARYLTAANFL